MKPDGQNCAANTVAWNEGNSEPYRNYKPVITSYDYDAPISEAGDYGQPGTGPPPDGAPANKFEVRLSPWPAGPSQSGHGETWSVSYLTPIKVDRTQSKKQRHACILSTCFSSSLRAPDSVSTYCAYIRNQLQDAEVHLQPSLLDLVS